MSNYLENTVNLAVGLYKGKIMTGPLAAITKHCAQHLVLFQGKEKVSKIAKVIHKKIGGDLDEIKAMNPDLEDFAKKCGCAGISLNGRPGWVKALTDLGYGAKKLHYVTKEFSE